MPPRVPLPEPWTFSTVRGPPGVAVPDRCRFRAPLLRAEVAVTTHFAADARSLGVLVVAETQAEPAVVLRSGVLALDASGGSTAGAWMPWPDARSAPRVARLGDGWVSAWEVERAKGTSEVVLFRDGAAASLGTGDAFATADLACGPGRCALLTSRLGRVAPAGADVVLFEAAADKAVQTISIEPSEGTSAARPFGLVDVESPRGVGAVLIDDGEATLWAAEAAGGAAPGGRVLAKLGVLDALLLRNKLLVLAHGNVVDAQGCAREGADAGGAKVLLLREGEAAIELRSPGPPGLATLRPLARGALVLWVAPLGCGAERRVVYGVVLDAAGVPVAAPLPLADGETFAAAAAGADVDLWIRRAAEVMWLRLTCDGAAAGP